MIPLPFGQSEAELHDWALHLHLQVVLVQIKQIWESLEGNIVSIETLEAGDRRTGVKLLTKTPPAGWDLTGRLMMKWALLGLLCLSLAIAGTQAEEAEVVVTINGEDQFSKAVKDSEFLLAEFYAPWCGHCKSLAPEYEQAAKMLKESGSKIVLAKVRCHYLAAV